MSTAEDEPSSGLNGRLRPRKSGPSPQTTKALRKLDSKIVQDKPKRITTPSKVSPNKSDDLTVTEENLCKIICAFCDETFFSKQTLSKHVRRVHLLSSTQDNVFNCLFCNHSEADADDIIQHMTNNHPNQYFACYDCHTRFLSTTELAEHKLNVCEKQKLPYRNKLRQKTTPKKNHKSNNIHGGGEFETAEKNFPPHNFNGIVISCELKSSHPNDSIDIEDNITTNLILPPNKSLSNTNVIEKNAIIVLDDLQWNKRIPHNFSFHNTDADQILSRLGVVHRSPRTGDSNKKDWLKHIDDSNQKFEKCFDTSFYSKVASNVQENLMKFLDGSFNFNPDPENTIKTRKSKNCVAINTVEGFPILLAAEQFCRNHFDGYMPRTIAPKHKWKWDNLESDKNLMSPEQMKRDSHANNCIISLVSSLDIWTQLCMRRKFEEKICKSPTEKKIDKQSIIGKELKEILESRELPASSSQVVKYKSPTQEPRDASDFPSFLGLVPNAPSFDLKPAVLSGEWVRPRCYVCCACGTQTRDSKALSLHISTQHPNAQIQHYEIVGEVLLNSDILKHLYVPPSQLNNRTRPLRGFKECTKCQKSISLEDLHQHMLDCAGDTPTVRRKCRYRPFGVRKRRPRLPDNTIRQEMRQDIRHPRHHQKTHMTPRPKIRTEVGDAETIRKMLADLPPKRHRAIINPIDTILRPRRKRCQRSKLIIKKRTVEEMKRKQHFGDILQDNNDLNDDEAKESSCDSEKIGQATQPSVKLVASKILNHHSLNKKTTVNRCRRKNFTDKDAEENKDSEDIPAQGNSGLQINQMSTEQKSQRINMNDNNGSFNTREHSNHNGSNNSNNNNQSPNSSGQNNGSRDSIAPSHHAPLKHSIASLTASSETHDKSVQFHQMFLVQQECNNTTQHLPTGQRVYFESEAVVTKLDKPPLHFNHQEAVDGNFCQKNKLNKPRKGLNDCIAMLKNKLVEPNTNILPGHVSVQCGSDEPLDPEPAVIERRHSTTESNIESAQRALQMFYPNNTVEDTQCYDMNSRVTRRSTTRSHGRREKILNVNQNQSPNDYMYWNQLYCNKQLMQTNRSGYRYNRRESTRRRSVVSTEELLLQQAINYEMLANTNKNMNNFNEYQFPHLATQHKPTKRNRQDSYKPRSNASNRVTKPKNKESKSRQRKMSTTNTSQRSYHKVPEIDPQLIQRIDMGNGGHFEHRSVNSTIAENVSHYYVQSTRLEDKSIDHSMEKSSFSSNLPEEQICPMMCQNMPMLPYPSERNAIPVHYNVHQDSASAPLDLSNQAVVEESIHYNIAAEPYTPPLYNSFETLDLSNKNVNITLSETERCLNSDVVVDLRVNNSSQPMLCCSSTLPPELDRSTLQENATDLSCRNQEILNRDDYLPTDLSMKRKDVSGHIYEKSPIYDNTLEVNVIHDLSHPIRHEQNVCMMIPNRDEPTNEEPTDLSTKRTENRSIVSAAPISEEHQIHLNMYNSKPGHNEEDIPADLSTKNVEIMRNNYYMSEPRMPRYTEVVVLNNDEVTSINNCIDLRLSRNSIELEQMNVQYNIEREIPLQINSLEPRSVIAYSNPILEENIAPKNFSNSSVPCDIPITINCTSLNQNGTRNDIAYVMNEMPLSLCIKNNSEYRSKVHRESGFRDNDYNNCPPAGYPLTQYVEPINDNVNTSININASATYTAVESTPETVPAYHSCASSVIQKSHNIEKRKSSCENENLEATKYLQTDRSSDNFYHLNAMGQNINTFKINYNQSNLDQDPETAKKIAMLPKELVEILGTMPIDHRNQLLNILPQYVSTTSSPVLLSNTESFRRNSISSSTISCNQSQSDFTNGFSPEDRRMLLYSTSQIMEPTPNTITSSVLLTPPTPQLSDRQSNQSHENEEIKVTEYRRKSISNDEQTSLRKANSENMNVTSRTSLLKRIATTNEHIDQDRVIDLTGDEISQDTSDIVYHSETSTPNATNTSKDISNPIATSNSTVLKITNDKTASLRAVRIKTSSERQRSIFGENTLPKKHPDSEVNIIDAEFKNKNSEIATSKAIQQAEISSTQHRSSTRTSPPKQVQTEKPLELPFIDKQQMPLGKKNISKATHGVTYNISDKQNVVSSSFLKERNRHSKNDNICHVQKNSSSKICHSNNTLNVKSIEKTGFDLSIQINESNDLCKEIEMEIDESEPTILPMEEDDSEDDISLAVIVKQKQQDLNEDKIHKEKKSKKKKHNIKQIPYGELSSEEENKIILSPNRKSSNAIIDSGEIESLNQNIEAYRDTNNITENCVSKVIENATYLKKKSKKGRRTNDLGTKHAEQESTLHKTNEIDKENNISETTKNAETVDESLKTKQSDLEINRSSTNNHVINNNKETCFNVSARRDKEKVNTAVECDTSVNMNTSQQHSETVIKENDIVIDKSKENSQKCKLMSTTENVSYIAPNTNKYGKTFSNVSKDIENNGTAQKVSSSKVKFKVNDDKSQNNSNITKESLNINCNVKHDEKIMDKKVTMEIEDNNITPVRRSRRGKSLFIDSNSATSDIGSNTDSSTEHRAPLTKKEIIFSKLLQDEENYHKPIFNTTQDKQIPVCALNKQIDLKGNVTNKELIEQQYANEIKGNKRKKSPQSKNKYKKQKSLSNANLEEKVTETNSKVKEVKIASTPTSDHVVSTPNPSSQIQCNYLGSNQTKTADSDNVIIEISGNIKKSTSIEKRKSSSDRCELQLSSNPKKSKLIDEETTVPLNKLKDNKCGNEKSVEQNKIILSASALSRNMTCYNKATRRARSKSVVVNSSKNELYDPYDIDLEEMVDKTEPFVRKEMSPRISFNAFKSAIVAKSRKLTKTVPSTNTNILPLESISSTGPDRTNLTINSHVSTEKNNNSRPKDTFSDSDESSKSDVPLKTFAEEKERKLRKMSSTEGAEKADIIMTNAETSLKLHETLKRRKKSKQVQSENQSEKEINKADNEDELRSEQFMESFGFFSERKPRKSNLLATKKISETFNLIENDELYYASNELVAKKSANEKKEDEIKVKPPSVPVKKITKRGRKKKRRVKIKPSFCHICKRAFRRWDNYIRHLLSIFHISKLCEIELKVKTILVEEEPNYLLVYRQQLNRLKILQNKIAKRKKNCLSTADIILPTLEQILDDVKRTVREQISRRSLSRDEALFVDCCEMLKSMNNDSTVVKKRVRQCNSYNCEQACQEELALLEQSILDDRCDIKSDDEMDSAAAKEIMESEEVRNLENDLISNLKEANGLKGPLNKINSHIVLSNYKDAEESSKIKYKRHSETKDKLYPDIPENVDMFEDKFDKIKRKCRSQAAAAKQLQTHIELNSRHKNRKKSEKKKAKRSFRKRPNTVPTKAALKGFDGIKVSIPTSDIDLSSIVPSIEKTHKRKKKRSSKKKRNRKLSEKSSCSEKSNSSDKSNKIEESVCTRELSNKKVDVYEFMDEDSEIFELRPSTLTDRFKANNNKDLPTSSKSVKENDLIELTSESGSDGDDFVYMSDDYVCSDEETENSMLSCELGLGKGISDRKKTLSPLKRKDAAEKSAVMGKIFKHNAVRSDRNSPKMREFAKPKANLDQLFDSLLEDEPKTTPAITESISEKDASSADSKISPIVLPETEAAEKPKKESVSPLQKHSSSPSSKKVLPKKDELPPPSRVYLSLSPQKITFEKDVSSPPSRVYLSLSPQKDDALRYDKKTGRRFDQALSITSETGLTQKYSTPSPTLHPSLSSFSTRRSSITPPKKMEANVNVISTKESLTLKRNDDENTYGELKEHDRSKYKYESSIPGKGYISREEDDINRRSDDYSEKQKSKDKVFKDKSEKKKKERDQLDTFDYTAKSFDWTMCDDTGVARQRARRKCTVGKQNVLAETWSSESEPDGAPPRPNSAESVVASNGRKKRGKKRDGLSGSNRKTNKLVSTKKQENMSRVGSGNRGAVVDALAKLHYWSEGEEEQEHPQQHGWIVGDSHKKLVTMLAHAKGRKRSGDEKRHLLE